MKIGRKNRNKVSIIADLLSAAGSGSSKTHIMYTANLSYKLLEKYLESTLGLGFIILNGSGYELTVKGRKFLKRYQSFKQRYSEAQDNFKALDYEKENLNRLCSGAV